ncbi:MAG: heat shock protein HspQ [Verrucomicrobiota bacterium]
MIRLQEGYRGDGEVLFGVGQVVRHRRYGYRGVVVALTGCFEGSEEWYRKNQTQPPKDQAWYHVLVDGSPSVTYAAESSLEADDLGEGVSHPLLEMFFSGFEGGRYVRNEVPWEL